jgi:MFS family permease
VAEQSGEQAGSGQGPDGSSPGALTVLRTPAYRLLFLGSTALYLAVHAQAIARGWLARDLTGSNTGLGGVFLAFGLAMLVTTPFAGVAADRFPKRTVLTCALLLLASTSAWLATAVLLDSVSYWMLVVAGALQAVAFAVYAPARMAFIAELVTRQQLGDAVVLAQMSQEGMRIAGPVLAGLLIAAATQGTGLVFAAGTVLGVVATATALRLPRGAARPTGAMASPLRQLGDAVRYVRGRHDLRALVLCSFAVVVLGFPYIAFLPTIADRVFEQGSLGYGLLSTASAAGAVAAGVAVTRRRPRDPWRLVAWSGALFGLALVVLALAPSFATALLVLVVVGGATLVFQTTNQSLVLSLGAEEVHGRIQGLVMLGFSGFGIAALPLGLLADAIGIRETFALMGLATLLAVAAFWRATGRYRGRPSGSQVVDLG